MIRKDILIIARGRYIYMKLVHLLAEATAFRQACLTTSRLAEHRRAATAHNYSLGVAEDSCAVRENTTVRASVSDACTSDIQSERCRCGGIQKRSYYQAYMHACPSHK